MTLTIYKQHINKILPASCNYCIVDVYKSFRLALCTWTHHNIKSMLVEPKSVKISKFVCTTIYSIIFYANF